VNRCVKIFTYKFQFLIVFTSALFINAMLTMTFPPIFAGSVQYNYID